MRGDRTDYSNEGEADNEHLAATVALDLRQVPCPLSWLRAKLCLEQLARGQVLVVRLDDPKGAADLPRAAEAEGYAVLQVGHDSEANEWQIVIEK